VGYGNQAANDIGKYKMYEVLVHGICQVADAKVIVGNVDKKRISN